MKTLELKLKKDVLIVDAEGLEITQGLIFNKFGNYNLSYYDYICKGSELIEEIASKLVEKMRFSFIKAFLDYRPYIYSPNHFKSAVKSFISAVESKGFYWLEKECDNQFCENGKVDVGYNTFLNCQVCEEAEEKTFKNPLIFVKTF